jgi:hypothetical protein
MKEQKMKEQIERLAALNLNPELFYVITLWEYEISLQGFVSQRTLTELKLQGFDFVFDSDADYLRATKDGIKIILTFNK